MSPFGNFSLISFNLFPLQIALLVLLYLFFNNVNFQICQFWNLWKGIFFFFIFLTKHFLFSLIFSNFKIDHENRFWYQFLLYNIFLSIFGFQKIFQSVKFAKTDWFAIVSWNRIEVPENILCHMVYWQRSFRKVLQFFAADLMVNELNYFLNHLGSLLT